MIAVAVVCDNSRERSGLYVFHILKMYLIRTICAFTFSAQDSAFNVLVHWPFKDCNPGSYLCLQLTPFPATSSSCLLWIPVQMHVLTTTVLCKSLVSPIMSSYFAREMWNWSNLLQHLHTHFTTFILQLQYFCNFCNFFKVVFRNGLPGFLEGILKPLLLLGIVFAFYTILYQDWALSRLELLRVPSMTGSVIFFHPGMLLLHWECPWDHFYTEKKQSHGQSGAFQMVLHGGFNTVHTLTDGCIQCCVSPGICHTKWLRFETKTEHLDVSLHKTNYHRFLVTCVIWHFHGPANFCPLLLVSSFF